VLSNPDAFCDVHLSNFTSCASNASGGAIAAVNLAHLSASNSTFQGNEASGLGGGALYSMQVACACKFSMCFRSCRYQSRFAPCMANLFVWNCPSMLWKVALDPFQIV
jgi:predicted outer membrane repeat protein